VEHGANIILELFIIFLAAKVAGELFERLGQPAVIGELIAGVIIGPGLLGWVTPDVVLDTVAQMGVVVLLFMVGLETRPDELLKVGPDSLLVGVLGVLLPFGAGWAYMATTGAPVAEQLFIAVTLVATSVGITARVLRDKGLIETRAARIIIGAAVIDDILGMLALAVVGSVSAGSVNVWEISLLAGGAVLFVVFLALAGPRVARRGAPWVDRLRIENAGFAVAILLMLGLAALAEQIQLAGIVGAFLAGMALAETQDRWELHKSMTPLYEWLVPYFFVVMGLTVDVKLFMRPEVLVPGLIISVIAIATKLAGGMLGSLRNGWKQALAVGYGMIPRGEVGLIVAAVGLSRGIVEERYYAVAVLMVVVTTVIVPPVLPGLFSMAGLTGSPAALRSEADEDEEATTL
jgi:Kef-type K+ transport system membrane component KefB